MAISKEQMAWMGVLSLTGVARLNRGPSAGTEVRSKREGVARSRGVPRQQEAAGPHHTDPEGPTEPWRILESPNNPGGPWLSLENPRGSRRTLENPGGTLGNPGGPQRTMGKSEELWRTPEDPGGPWKIPEP